MQNYYDSNPGFHQAGPGFDDGYDFPGYGEDFGGYPYGGDDYGPGPGQAPGCGCGDYCQMPPPPQPAPAPAYPVAPWPQYPSEPYPYPGPGCGCGEYGPEADQYKGFFLGFVRNRFGLKEDANEIFDWLKIKYPCTGGVTVPGCVSDEGILNTFNNLQELLFGIDADGNITGPGLIGAIGGGINQSKYIALWDELKKSYDEPYVPCAPELTPMYQSEDVIKLSREKPAFLFKKSGRFNIKVKLRFVEESLIYTQLGPDFNLNDVLMLFSPTANPYDPDWALNRAVPGNTVTGVQNGSFNLQNFIKMKPTLVMFKNKRPVKFIRKNDDEWHNLYVSVKVKRGDRITFVMLGGFRSLWKTDAVIGVSVFEADEQTQTKEDPHHHSRHSRDLEEDDDLDIYDDQDDDHDRHDLPRDLCEALRHEKVRELGVFDCD